MARKKLALFVHIVWRTWDSQPLITPEIERPLYRVIHSEANRMGCEVLALNGSTDHVHLMITFPTTITLGELVQQVKGNSSHFANEKMQLDYQFKWQGGYGAFTVSRWDVKKIVGYVKRQKEHHKTGELWSELEQAVIFAEKGSSV